MTCILNRTRLRRPSTMIPLTIALPTTIETIITELSHLQTRSHDCHTYKHKHTISALATTIASKAAIADDRAPTTTTTKQQTSTPFEHACEYTSTPSLSPRTRRERRTRAMCGSSHSRQARLWTLPDSGDVWTSSQSRQGEFHQSETLLWLASTSVSPPSTSSGLATGALGSRANLPYVERSAKVHGM